MMTTNLRKKLDRAKNVNQTTGLIRFEEAFTEDEKSAIHIAVVASSMEKK